MTQREVFSSAISNNDLTLLKWNIGIFFIHYMYKIFRKLIFATV